MLFIDFGIKILYNIKCTRIAAKKERPKGLPMQQNTFLFFAKRVIFMLLDVIQSGFEPIYVMQLLFTVVVFLLALSVHESAHGLAANALGDPTARNLGRITLNPIKHIDLYGALAMLIFGFGWAKPVPVNTRYMKNARWGFVATSLAGPFSNLLLAFVFAVIRAIVLVVLANLFVEGAVSVDLVSIILIFFMIAIGVNVSLAIFNMLPIPPLDGSRLLTACIPRRWAMWSFRYEHIIQIGLFVLLYFGAFTGVLGGARETVTGFVTGVVDLIPFRELCSEKYVFDMFNAII